MNMFTPQSALRYYIGDVSGNDPFFGDTKAYVTINSLFFPGIRTESARAAEGKRLNPAIISDIPRLIGYFEALFGAFAESHSKAAQVCRVERFADFTLCKNCGCTLSMTSTSYAGFLGYYADRRGIALMRFNIPENAPCIKVAEYLDFYAKPEEQELLIPPFMSLDIAENAPSAEEADILDCDGKPPLVSCRVRLGGIVPYMGDVPALPKDGGLAGMRVYDALNGGKTPCEADIALYSEWKSALQKLLRKMINDMKKTV